MVLLRTISVGPANSPDHLVYQLEWSHQEHNKHIEVRKDQSCSFWGTNKSQTETETVF